MDNKIIDDDFRSLMLNTLNDPDDDAGSSYKDSVVLERISSTRKTLLGDNPGNYTPDTLTKDMQGIAYEIDPNGVEQTVTGADRAADESGKLREAVSNSPLGKNIAGATPAVLEEQAAALSPSEQVKQARDAAPTEEVVEQAEENDPTVMENIAEIPGGLLSGLKKAMNEGGKFLDDVVGLTGIEVPHAGEDIVENKFEAKTGTGAVVETISRFIPWTVAATAALPVAGTVGFTGTASKAAYGATRAVTAGAIADMVASDPHQERISTMLNEVPAMEAIIPDWLADNDPQNESAWEGRWKNFIEGMGIGAVADTAVKVFPKVIKAYKAARQAKAGAVGEAKTVATAINDDILKESAKAKALDDIVVPTEPKLGAAEMVSKTDDGKISLNLNKVTGLDDIHKILDDAVSNAKKSKKAEQAVVRADNRKVNLDLDATAAEKRALELADQAHDGTEASIKQANKAHKEAVKLRKMADDAIIKADAAVTKRTYVTGLTEEEIAAGKTLAGDVIEKTPEGKTYVNLKKVDTDDTTKVVMQNMADEVDNAKVTTNIETEAASKEVYTELSDLLGRDPKRPFTAAEGVAARDIMTASGEDVGRLAKLVKGSTDNEDMFNFLAAVEKHRAIQEVVIAGRKATAQGLQAFNIPAKASLERSKMINEFVGAFGSRQTTLRPGKLAETIANLVDSGADPKALAKVLNQSTSKKLADAWYQVWINGLLSGPATHAANMISNTATAVWSIPEKYVAAGFEALRGNGGEALAAANGRASGIFGGLADGWQLMTGKATNEALTKGSKLDRHVDAISAVAWGKSPDSTIGKGLDYLGKIVNLPGWALGKGDNFFKGLAYRMKLHEEASLTAYREGIKPGSTAFKKRVADFVSNPPESAVGSAIDSAEYFTFTNKLGATGNMVGGVIQRVPGARYIVPFQRTPTNILKFAFDRTPLAPLSSKYKEAIKAGGATAAEAQARMAAGSVLMLGGVGAAMGGLITGGGPADPAKRRAWELAGNQRYSIKVGDKFYSYERIEPLATLIGISADMANVMGQTDEEESGNMIAASLTALSNNLMSRTYLKGAAEFMDMIVNGTTAEKEAWAVKMGASLAQPFYSGAGRTINHYFIDDVKRDYKTEEHPLSFVKQMILKAGDTIPGFGSGPALRDVFGEELSYHTDGVMPAYEAISPIKVRKNETDPVKIMIAENEIGLSRPSQRIGGIKLSNEEYSKYCEIAGKMAKEQLDRLYNDGYFDRMTDGPEGMKAKVVKDVLRNAREFASNKMQADDLGLQSKIFAEKKRLTEGLTGRKL